MMLPHLTLQEEKDSGFDEVGIHALSASSLGHAVIFRVSMTEQSANKDENVQLNLILSNHHVRSFILVFSLYIVLSYDFQQVKD